jgi:hypothetical protein
MNRILDKMTIELTKAKQEQNEVKIREHLIVMRTLCDLVLDEKQEMNEKMYVSNNELDVAVKKPIVTSKLEEEDGNGDSLLDF